MDDRLAEIMVLQGALSSCWTPLEKHLQALKNDYLTRLVAENNDETRGRIKELNDLLELPERLQQDAMNLQHPQQEAELP